jgi:phosphatidylserine/phosphatidylglycerophosphate/cardiolipin synthase-like enzyme
MINLICDVQPPGPHGPSEIDLASYVYQLDNVTQALLWAHQYMQATVHVALDGANKYVTATDGTVTPSVAYDDLVAGLPTGSVLLCGPNAGVAPPPPSPGDDNGNGRPFPSGTGCAGDNIMHTKLLLVSAVDSARDPAVFTSSQNFSTTAEVSAFNNGLQVVGNDEVFDDDQAYFQQLRTDKQQPDVGDTVSSADTTTPGGVTLHTYYYPRNNPPVFPAASGYDEVNDSATDNVGDLLSNVGCGNPGSVAGDHSGATAKTTVQVAMYDFGNRQIIRNKLESLADRGCEVSIVYAEMTDGTLKSFEKHPDITLMQIDDLAYPFPDGSGTGYIFVHDKYLLVSGAIQTSTGTERDQNLVLTGSQNFTEHGLHFNDESTLSLQQPATNQSTQTVFGQYEGDWTRLVQVAAQVTPPA